MQFIAGEGNTTSGGFQLSLLSVPDDFCYIIAATTGQGADSHLRRIRNQIWGNNKQDKNLVNHLVKLLAPTLSEKVFQKSEQEDNHLMVVEEQ